MAYISNLFRELVGTTWDGTNRYTTLTANTALGINSQRRSGMLYIVDNSSYTLSINGTAVTINNSGPTMIGFVRVGTDFIFNVDTSPVVVATDSTLPTVVSATASTSATIVVVFSEVVTATNTGWSFKQNGATINPDSISGSGTNTLTFTFSETLINTDTILRSYDSSTGNTLDPAGNELASFTDQAVTNGISGIENVDWTSESNTTDAGSGTLNGNNTTTPAGAVATRKMVGNGYVEFNITNKTNSAALVIAIQQTNNTNYQWTGSTQPLLGAMYHFTNIFWDSGNPDSSPTSLGATGSYNWLRIERSGNDILYRASPDGTSYTTLHTATGAVTGITDLYIKAIFAANAATKSMVTTKALGLTAI